jgi:hypothetical protein
VYKPAFLVTELLRLLKNAFVYVRLLFGAQLITTEGEPLEKGAACW